MSTTQTIIDHNLTNDNKSIMTPGVLSHKISDHYPIYCTIKNINNKPTSAVNKYSFVIPKILTVIIFEMIWKLP